jgi:Xaa-Pro aminopeptidase
MADIRLSELDLRIPEPPSSEPTIPNTEFHARIARLRTLMKLRKLDAMIIYGDREHFGNIAYLSGYDPRFEEAILIVGKANLPILFVGLEGIAYAKYVAQIHARNRVVPYFSLMGQSRSKSMKPKEPCELFREAGIKRGMKIGIAGWKHYTQNDFKRSSLAIEIPSYLVDALRQISGSRANVTNANDLLIDPKIGLRNFHSPNEIAAFEFAATTCSRYMHNLIANLQPGMTEYEAAESMMLNGMPLITHVMLSSGDRARVGLCSPSAKTINRGDPLTAAFGVRGSLVCRAAYVVESEAELENIQFDYLSNICIPYFRLLSTWYRLIAIGASGNDVFNTINQQSNELGLDLALNPGHFIDLEEWTNSPFYPGSPYLLTSGMVLQSDMIPIVPSHKFGVNAEDTLVIADEELRNSLKHEYPEMWHRIEKRREFMIVKLGLTLSPEVLPLSDNAAVLRPFLLSKSLALTQA